MTEALNAVAEERRQLIAEMIDSANICGGVVPATEAEFWAAIAVHYNLAPLDSPTATAQAVFESLGEAWDDDYVEEDSTLPAVPAYEALHALLTRREPPSLSPAPALSEAEEDEDDDDSIGKLDHTFNLEAPPVTWNLDSVMNMVDKGSLVLNPEWQRSFVWKPQKQRRLIESILLGLPIPSFLLFQDTQSGKMYVIDGRQRLETIARFRSPKEERGQPKRRFRTFPPKTEGWGQGERLNTASSKYYDALPTEFRVTFDNTPLIVCTFKDIPSDRLYQIFKRYNTGAVALKAAEIRNAVYQGRALHAMMYRLAGEHRDASKYRDTEERSVGEGLRETMGSKRERYGAYDFVGRYFAFSYMSTGTVANATNAFMVTHGKTADDVEHLRREFIDVYIATIDLYGEYPLVDPRPGGPFHAFLATLQMVSARHLLANVASKRVTLEAAREAIRALWRPLAEEVVSGKQNSGVFWGVQKRWIGQLETTLGLHPVGV